MDRDMSIHSVPKTDVGSDLPGVMRTSRPSSALASSTPEDSSSIDESEPDTTAHEGDLDNDLEKRPTEQMEERQPNVVRVVTAQDWNGPDDPENPHNWPMPKRVYHSLAPALPGFVMTFATSVMQPSAPGLVLDFHVSATVATLPLTLWTLGLALGPVIASPLSETYGRNFVYKIATPVSLLFLLGAGFSQNIASILILRFLGGFTGGPVLAVGGATNADLWPPRLRARSTSVFLMSPFLGPAIGPLVGGFVAQYKTWRWSIWTNLFIGAFVYIFCLPMQETYKKIILQRRAKKLNIPPPPSTLPSQPLAFAKYILTVTLFRPIHMLLREPIVSFMSLYTAFAFSILFGFFTAFPYTFQRPPYNFSISQTGLVYIPLAIGVVLAGLVAIYLDVAVYGPHSRRAIAAGKPAAAPEHRLYPAMIGSLTITIGLFWFAWTADKGAHWAAPLTSTIFFAFGNFSLFFSTGMYMVDVYGPLNGASALAANGILRYGMGSVFPLFGRQMYEALGIGWATSLFGFVSAAMIPIPWILFKWGPKIRGKSSYETTKF